MPNEGEFHVVDLCGTLVKDDTTLGFLEWHFRRLNRRISRGLVQGVRGRRSPLRWGAMAVERFFGRHLAKRYLVGLLRGAPITVVEESATGYAKWLVQERLNVEILSLLQEKHRQCDGRCRQIIASASLEPIVAAVSKELGFLYVASRLEVHEGRLTGKYECDITGRKAEALVAKFDETVLAGMSMVVSDNISDLSLMQRAEEAYAVVHGERQRKRWPEGQLKVLNLRDGK